MVSEASWRHFCHLSFAVHDPQYVEFLLDLIHKKKVSHFLCHQSGRCERRSAGPDSPPSPCCVPVLWLRTAAAQRTRESLSQSHESQSQSHCSLCIHEKHRMYVNEILYDTSISGQGFCLRIRELSMYWCPVQISCEVRRFGILDFREQEAQEYRRVSKKQTTTSGSQLGGGEINIRDQS